MSAAWSLTGCEMRTLRRPMRTPQAKDSARVVRTRAGKPVIASVSPETDEASRQLRTTQ